MPFAVEHGVIKGNMNNVGARKVVQCNEGYNETTGNCSTVCQEDGTWGNIPVCKKSKYLKSSIAQIFTSNIITF